MENFRKVKLAELLAEYITDHKKNLIDKFLKERTRYLTVVLEDIYKEHNASAVLRTVECLGIQDIHIIEERYTYNINPGVTMGSSKWLTIKKYSNPELNNTKRCYHVLKENGYQIIATSPNVHKKSIFDVALNNKTAVVFGTELDGLTNYALENADETVQIPMYGFTESYNLSVSVAIGMSAMKQRLKDSKVSWHLTDDEKLDLKLSWYKKIVKSSEMLKKKFLDN